MIHDLDATLDGLLNRALPSVAISFEPPDAAFAPSLPAVDLFLYDVRENRDLRENDWLEQRDGRTVTRRPPPVRVDCSYLITAWAGDVRNEHLLLGQVATVLLRHPALPSELLVGDLRNQPVPPPTSTLAPGRLQSTGEFWQALGGKPKAALTYTVTIALEPVEPTEVAVVLESDVRIRQTPSRWAR